MNEKRVDYSAFDAPEITRFLFYPRPESGRWEPQENSEQLTIPVGDEVNLGGRFYFSRTEAPNLLFFHGNGEVVEDYDELAVFYQRLQINFIPVDYRGYGRSAGTPNVSTMMEDCHIVLRFIKDLLATKGFSGPLILMGRSLGSASALELAAHHQKEVDGLIIESGFAYLMPLLRLLGINPGGLGPNLSDCFVNHEKIRCFNKPTLIIHAEQDHIIPFSDGEALYENAADREKAFLRIPGANHNDIFARGLEPYLTAVKKLTERVIKAKGREREG